MSSWRGDVKESTCSAPKQRGRVTPQRLRPEIAGAQSASFVHSQRCLMLTVCVAGIPKPGRSFTAVNGKPASINNVLNRLIRPAPYRFKYYKVSWISHKKADHRYEREVSRPMWHCCHAARRGLGRNLYTLGIPERTIRVPHSSTLRPVWQSMVLRKVTVESSACVARCQGSIRWTIPRRTA